MVHAAPFLPPRRPVLARRGRTALLRGAALAFAVALSACASTPRGERRSISIDVDNNLIPSSALTVWAVPDGGTQILVGNVGPSERKTLTFTPTSRALTYRLRARMTGGRDRISNPISMVEAGRVIWNVQSNLATVGSSTSE